MRAKAPAGTVPPTRASFLAGGRKRGWGPVRGCQREPQNPRLGTPATVGTHRLPPPLRHGSRKRFCGRRAFTPPRGTPGSQRLAVRAQLWLPEAVPPYGSVNPVPLGVDSASVKGKAAPGGVNANGLQRLVMGSDSQSVISGLLQRNGVRCPFV